MEEELLKKYIKNEKCKKFSISIRKRVNILSQKEIDKLLTTVVRKGIFKTLDKLKYTFYFTNDYWWEIKIRYKDRSWEISIFRKK